MLHLRGVRKGHRIKNPKGNGDKVEEDQRTKKNIGESLQKAKETHLVVAAWIATVTFAAGFTMPGGYQSEIGPDQGSAILSRTAAFKAFVITDTLAMAMSSCSVLVLLYSPIHTKWNSMNQISMTFHMVVSLTMWALIAMVVAFITGTYAILGGHSPGLAVAACVLGCIFFFVFANSLLSTERKILKAPHILIDMVRGYLLMMSNLLIAIGGSLVGLPPKL